MPLNIKNTDVDRLVEAVATRSRISKTEAVRRALERALDELERPRAHGRGQRALTFLERDVWPTLADDVLGSAPSREEREDILGYREEGV